MSAPDAPTVPNGPVNAHGGAEEARAIPETIAPVPEAREDGLGPPFHPDDLGTFGPYRILKKLGQGGMGTVYLAEDPRLGRRVALKVCRRANKPELLERFRREARAAASLRHRNLCPVHECNVIGGMPYFTMALIEGPTLDHWVEQRGGLSEREAAVLLRKLALAMHYAHRNGVIHRDLKPSNIALEHNEPIILDFGLALCTGLSGAERQTVEGVVLGTPGYMAPEQVTGDITAMGPASDIYSLGAILYEWLTGRPVFEGPPMVVLGQIVTSSGPQRPSELVQQIDPDLEAICLRCLAKGPADRWPDMGALAAALTEWLKSSRQKARAATTQTATEKGTAIAPSNAAQEADATQVEQSEPERRRQRRRGNRRRRSPGPWLWIILGLALGVVLAAVVVIILVVHAETSSSLDDVAAQGAPPADLPGTSPATAGIPVATVRGYLVEVFADGRVGIVVPGNFPERFAVAPEAEVRIPEPPPLWDDQGHRRKPTPKEIEALRGDRSLPGFKATLADLRIDSYVVVDLMQSVDGRMIAQRIVAQAPPPGYPPPPDHHPPPPP
jgi:serine/threonine protein kinase